MFRVIDTERYNGANVHQNLPKTTENSVIITVQGLGLGLGLGLGIGLVFRFSDTQRHYGMGPGKYCQPCRRCRPVISAADSMVG